MDVHSAGFKQISVSVLTMNKDREYQSDSSDEDISANTRHRFKKQQISSAMSLPSSVSKASAEVSVTNKDENCFRVRKKQIIMISYMQFAPKVARMTTGKLFPSMKLLTTLS